MRLPRATHLVIVVDGFPRWEWVEKAAYKGLLEELGKLEVQANQEKNRMVGFFPESWKRRKKLMRKLFPEEPSEVHH